MEYILSWPTDSQSLGPILPYLSASGSIWLCVWVGLVRIYYFFLHRVCHKMLYLPLIVTKTEELVYFCHNTITIYLQMYPEIL